MNKPTEVYEEVQGMGKPKTHWKQLINPDYIGAYSLPEGNDMTVIIESVSREIVTSVGGRKEECSVARLRGNKPLILNVTNNQSIARLYGPYIEDWAGKSITLCASTTKFAGETVECIRIRPQVATEKKAQPITDERLATAISSINSGDYSLEKLKKHFVLTEAQLQEVNSRAVPA